LLRGILDQMLEQMPQLRDILHPIFGKKCGERVDAEGLGDLSSDLAVFFKRRRQHIDSDLEDALNSLVLPVKSRQDVSAEIDKVFGGYSSRLTCKRKVGESSRRASYMPTRHFRI